MRICTRCLTEKKLDEFYNHVKGSQGKQSWCKLCLKEHAAASRLTPEGRNRNARYLLKHRYGLTQEEVDKMSEEQGGLCAICKERSWAAVDHCHTSGKIRGLLCHGCNGSLGHFEKHADAMSIYLEKI